MTAAILETLFPNKLDYGFVGLLLTLIVVAAIWAANRHKL